jgi:hypothetical protein
MIADAILVSDTFVREREREKSDRMDNIMFPSFVHLFMTGALSTHSSRTYNPLVVAEVKLFSQ